MSKKNLSPAQKAQKYGKNIKGVGIFYLIVMIVIVIFDFESLANPIMLLAIFFYIALCIAMIKCGGRARKLAVKIAWIFETLLVVSGIVSTFSSSTQGSASILPFINLIVIICLPSDIIGLSKALKELEK